MSNKIPYIGVSCKLINGLENVIYECMETAVKACAEHYKFDYEEAMNLLNLPCLKVEKEPESVIVPSATVNKNKLDFPIPYNGGMDSKLCSGICLNGGLYTQCQLKPTEQSVYCKKCKTQSERNSNGEPNYGTIQTRSSVGLYEFRDPNNKAPKSFLSILEKKGLTKEVVIKQASEYNIVIDPLHFEVDEENNDLKKGRPKKEKKVVDVITDLLSDFDSEKSNSDNEEPALSKTDKEESSKEDIKKVTKKKEPKEPKEPTKKAKEPKEPKEPTKKAKEPTNDEPTNESNNESNNEPNDEPTESNDKEKVNPDKVKYLNYNGEKLLKSTATGIVYNLNHERIGVWNNTTKEVTYDSDDEEEEEEEEYDE